MEFLSEMLHTQLKHNLNKWNSDKGNNMDDWNTSLNPSRFAKYSGSMDKWKFLISGKHFWFFEFQPKETPLYFFFCKFTPLPSMIN